MTDWGTGYPRAFISGSQAVSFTDSITKSLSDLSSTVSIYVGKVPRTDGYTALFSGKYCP